jgi:hypothetical protein
MLFTQNISRRLRIIGRLLRNLILFIVIMVALSGSAISQGGLTARVRTYTRPIEFEFASWTLNALTTKLSSWALSFERFLPPETQSKLVLDYLEQVRTVRILNAQILAVYSDPNIQDPDEASQPLRDELQVEEARLDSLKPVAEAILQTQLMDIVQDIGLDLLGQVFPPSLYQSSDVPYALIVSPRTEIVQAANISLTPGIKTEAKEQLETNIFYNLDHTALVVPVGGIGSYPAMVMQSSDLVWLTEVIAHEWVHNFLTLRPLGINYFTNAELRTINETTADLAGKELGRLMLQKYYPERVPLEPFPHEVDEPVLPQPQPEPDPDAFDFRAEMALTRVETDRLLAEGKITAAEAYMEARRQFLWENGIQIRKLNQAYFAFYGAYSAAPGGAAGEDPVGPAVVAFRRQFKDLADFLNTISWVNSFEALLTLLND